MNLIEHFTTVNTTAKANREIKYIVIHYTAGVSSSGKSDENIASWFSRAEAKASADFIVDDDSVTQFNGDIKNRYTWHCGGNKYNTKGGSLYGKCTNSNSIGIEICSNNTTKKATNPNDESWFFTKETINNAIELTKKLMAEYNIQAGNVIRHYDVTGKLCPGIVGWNADSGSEDDWHKFKAALTAMEEEVMPDMVRNNAFLILVDEATDSKLAYHLSKRCREFAIDENKIKLTFVEFEDFSVMNWCLSLANRRTSSKITWRHYNKNLTDVIFEHTFLCKLTNYTTCVSINGSDLQITMEFAIS